MLSPFLLSYAPDEVSPARLFGASLDWIQEPIVGGSRGHFDLERRRASGQTAPMILEPKLEAPSRPISYVRFRSNGCEHRALPPAGQAKADNKGL
jgi:hypothetical protein